MRQNPRHHHNTGYQSSGPLAPPTTLGPDGIPRPTRGPQAGPVLGFNIKACCYGFCQCIYDLIVFIFCCGFCFWMVHICCHDNDEDYDSNRRNNNRSGNNSNNNRTSYKAIPDPKQENKNKNKHIHSSYQNPNPSQTSHNSNSNNNNRNTNSGQDLVINTTNTTNSNPNSVNSIKSNSGGNRATAATTAAPAIAGTTNDVTISYHDNYQSQANAGAGASQTQNTSTSINTGSKPTSGEKLGATSMQQQRNESNPEEQYMI